MANQATPRFQLPYPGDAAEGWWDVFEDFATAIDTTMLSLMEANAWTFVELPDATVESDGGTGYQLRLLANCVMASRTYQSHLTIDYTVVLALTPGWLIVVRVPSGAVASATVALELWQNGVPLDPDYRVLGYVNADSSITWWNASVLAVGATQGLFSATGTGGGGGGERQVFVLDLTDPTVAPPGAPVVGDRYILDYSASPVHVGWGTGATVNDIVEYTATGWAHAHAEEGWAAYVRADLVDAIFLYDGGHWQWVLQTGGGPLQDAYDLGHEIVIAAAGPAVLITNNNSAAGHALQIGGTGLRDVYSAGALALRAAGGELTLDDTRYAGSLGPAGSLPLTNSGVTDFIFPCSSLVDAINKAYTGAGGIAWTGTTATAAPTEIFLGGVPSARYTLSVDSTTYFNLTCVARDNASNDSKVWDVKAVAAVDSAGNAALVGSPSYTAVAASAGAAAWAVAATVNDPDNSFRLTVTGGGVTIHWTIAN